MLEEETAWFPKSDEFPQVLQRDEPENFLIPHLYPVFHPYSRLEKWTPEIVQNGWPNRVSSLPYQLTALELSVMRPDSPGNCKLRLPEASFTGFSGDTAGNLYFVLFLFF